MALESDADLEGFFDANDFGTRATLTPSAGDPVEITGIFTAAHEVAGASGDWPGVSTAAPVLTIPASALPAGAMQGDALSIGAVAYRVRDIQPDGTGLARLVLEKE